MGEKVTVGCYNCDASIEVDEDKMEIQLLFNRWYLSKVDEFNSIILCPKCKLADENFMMIESDDIPF